MRNDVTRRIFGICDSASLFVAEQTSPVFGRHLVALSGKAEPVICYVGAARGDNPDRIAQFQRLANRIGARPSVLSLYDPPSANAADFFENVDIVFVDGGSTRNLLALLGEWGAQDAFRKAYAAGVIISGASAGVNILFDWSITDSIKTQIEPVAGLGLLKGSVCVHYDANPSRVLAFWDFVDDHRMTFPAYTLDDGTAIEFENEQLTDVCSIRDQAGVRILSTAGSDIDQRQVETRLLTAATQADAANG